jgi:6-phosphogluconolactonase
LRLVVAASAGEAAAQAAAHIAGQLRQAIAARRRATVALSGGTSAPALFAALARATLAWSAVQVLQVDERLVGRGNAARNLTALEQALVGHGPLPRANLHPMPVDDQAPDATAASYDGLIMAAGRPPRLDVVHLGLGIDGHTASLFAGDLALSAREALVALTSVQSGYRRMTLTLPVLHGARDIVWLVTGTAKARVLARLVAGGWDAPAGQVARESAVVFADEAAAAKV